MSGKCGIWRRARPHDVPDAVVTQPIIPVRVVTLAQADLSLSHLEGAMSSDEEKESGYPVTVQYCGGELFQCSHVFSALLPDTPEMAARTVAAGRAAATGLCTQRCSHPHFSCFAPAVCGLPPEYCQWGEDFERCKPWLRENCPELYPEVFGSEVDEVTDGVEGLAVGEASSGAGSKSGGSGEKKTKKAKKSGKKGKGEPKVLISRKDRNKRKYVTIVAGLEDFPGIKMKQASKALGKKFSCGASVSNTATGGKEIDIQGDVQYDLPAILVEKFDVRRSCRAPDELVYRHVSHLYRLCLCRSRRTVFSTWRAPRQCALLRNSRLIHSRAIQASCVDLRVQSVDEVLEILNKPVSTSHNLRSRDHTPVPNEGKSRRPSLHVSGTIPNRNYRLVAMRIHDAAKRPTKSDSPS